MKRNDKNNRDNDNNLERGKTNNQVAAAAAAAAATTTRSTSTDSKSSPTFGISKRRCRNKQRNNVTMPMTTSNTTGGSRNDDDDNINNHTVSINVDNDGSNHGNSDSSSDSQSSNDDDSSQFPGAYRIGGMNRSREDDGNDTILVSMDGGTNAHNNARANDYDVVVDDASIAFSTDGELIISLNETAYEQERRNHYAKVFCYYFWLIALLGSDLVYFLLTASTFGENVISLGFLILLSVLLVQSICSTFLLKGLSSINHNTTNNRTTTTIPTTMTAAATATTRTDPSSSNVGL